MYVCMRVYTCIKVQICRTYKNQYNYVHMRGSGPISFDRNHPLCAGRRTSSCASAAAGASAEAAAGRRAAVDLWPEFLARWTQIMCLKYGLLLWALTGLFLVWAGFDVWLLCMVYNG